MSEAAAIASPAVKSKGQQPGKSPEAEQIRPPEEGLRDRPLMVQAKLSVGAPDDPFEKEADDMADTVMRMPEETFVQRKCAECAKEEEEGKIQRSLKVPIPDEVPPGTTAADITNTTPVATKVAHFNGIIQSLCPSFEVNTTSGIVQPRGPGAAPTPAALAGSAHPVGCCGINILVNGANDWKIEMTQLQGPHTDPGNFLFALPPPRSGITFGDFTAADTRVDLTDVIVAGHEIVGHGAQEELGIHNQGREDRESFNHHDPTVRIQNIIQHEQGLPATMDRGLASPGVHRGESFAKVEIDNFAFNSSSIPASEAAKMQLAADFINANQVLVDIIGHSDQTGSARAKQQISDDRANAVKAELIRLGVTPTVTITRLPTFSFAGSRFTRVAGVSDSQPPATGAGVAANWRRVEIFIANHPAGAEVPPPGIPALGSATPGANLPAEQASADPCHSLYANSAFPAATAPAVPAPAVPAPAAPAAPAAPPVVRPKMEFLQRKCAECEKEEQLQRKGESGTPILSDGDAQTIESSKGGGSSMDRNTESFMSSRFGADFSNVRIHTDSTSAGLNRSLHAKAFTTGRDVYFNEGEYRPDSDSGKHLLAHELTHVVQQNGAGPAVQAKSRMPEVRSKEGLPVVQAKSNVPGVQRAPGDGGGRAVKTLSLTEQREEDKLQSMRFNVYFSDNTTASFDIAWEIGGMKEVPIGDDYLISNDAFFFHITNTHKPIEFSLVLIITDKSGKKYHSYDNLDNITTDDTVAQQSINDMQAVKQTLALTAFPLTVDFLDLTGEAPDTGKGKGDLASKAAPVRKPVFNFKLPEWFQQLKDKVEAKIKQDTAANKDNPFLPDKLIWYGEDIVQEKKGPDAWTIQIDKGKGMAFYTVLKKQWDDASDKEVFAGETVKIIYDKVEQVLTRPPENDKPTYEIDGTGDGNKFKQDNSKPQANPFRDLKKEDLEKVKELLQKLTGDTKPLDKNVPPPLPLSPDDVKALLGLAKDPQQDKIIEYLKAKTGNGVSTTRSIEELIAAARLKDAFKRFDITPEKSEDKQEPVVSRPVHGVIVQHDPLIVAKKTVSYSFEVRDNVDAMRVPWINIRWRTYADEKLGPKDYTPEAKGIKYMPFESEGIMNPKHFKVEYPSEGVYIVEAIVDHNYFLPNYFSTNVKVLDEQKVLKDKESKAYKGFLQDGTTSDIDFGQIKYGKGTVTRGKLDPTFKGATAQEQLDEIDKEIERIDGIITKYKEAKSDEGTAMVEWGEKYKEELKASRDKIAKAKDEKGQDILACRGTYISRTLGVKTADLKLTCFIRQGQKYYAGSGEGDTGSWEDGYYVHLYDRTQLYENKTYDIEEFATTSEAAMQAVFSRLSEAYPDGHISLAFQKWDDKTNGKTDEYIKYTRVTDTEGKDIKKVLFSAPVNIAVNVISVVLTMFPPTTAVGLTIGILYNGAQTISELQEQADKGTLTGTKVAIGCGSLVLDVLPGVGAVSKGAKIVQVGTKAYYLFEGVQLAGQAVLMYEQGMEEVETLRKDYFIKIADLDEQIAELEGTNPSAKELDQLKKDRQELLDKGKDATIDTFTKMAGQQLIFTVGAKFLHGVHEHYSAKSKLEARGKIADGLTEVPGLNPDERLAIADRIYDGDIEIRKSKKSGWKEEKGGYVLEVGENATKAEIDALLDNNPNVKPNEEPGAVKTGGGEEERPADKRPAHAEDEPAAKSPVDQETQTPTTATNEVHEYRIHKDGTISRCSDRCKLVVESTLGRAEDIAGVFGKGDPHTAKARELAKQARELAKEAKKASAIADPEQKKLKEKEVLDKATQLELDMATLEKAAIQETRDRFDKSLKDIDDFLVKYPEYKERFAKRIKNREERMKEILPKLTDPDPEIKRQAWEELKREGINTKNLARDMIKHADNMKRPDISKRFQFHVEDKPGRDYVKHAEGELGVPKEVMTHRSQTEQGKVSSGTGDDAGHLIANIFGAPGDERNLGKQNWIANEFGTWRQLEVQWAEKLVNGTRVSVIVREYAKVKGERPYKREVTWTETTPDGKTTTHQLTFGNFETAKSRAATGATPTPGVPEGGGAVIILNEERAKRGLAPVYSQEELNNMLKFLTEQSKAENDIYQAANDNAEL